MDPPTRKNSCFIRMHHKVTVTAGTSCPFRKTSICPTKIFGKKKKKKKQKKRKRKKKRTKKKKERRRRKKN